MPITCFKIKKPKCLRRQSESDDSYQMSPLFNSLGKGPRLQLLNVTIKGNIKSLGLPDAETRNLTSNIGTIATLGQNDSDYEDEILTFLENVNDKILKKDISQVTRLIVDKASSLEL